MGNTCDAGRDDGGKGETTPDYGMVLRALTDSVVANNVMHYNKEIEENLRMSTGTLRTHVAGIYKKLHVHSRTEAVVKYLQK